MPRLQLIGLAGLVACLLITPAIGQPLAGSYSVGSGGSYPDLAAAISALTANGVSGPTTFTVTANDASGPWTLGAITGQGAANPIVFDGLGTATLSGGAPMLTLSGCSDVTFSGFIATFASSAVGVSITGSTANCVFSGCNFTAPNSTSGSGKSFDLAGGTGCRIEDSTFGGGYEAFNTGSANDATTIQRCRITGGGFWISQMNGSNLTLVNNFITGPSQYGLRAGATATNLSIQHNSIYIVHPSPASQYCSLRWYSPTTTNSDVRNNVFADIYPAGSTTGLNMWCSGANRPTVMDYNDFYLANGQSLIYAGANLTLAGWQATGFDLNSVEGDPLYTAPTATPPDLSILSGSPCLMAGTTIPTVATDFFGQPRIPPVDIGAHEATSGNLLSFVTGGAGAGDLNLSLSLIDPLATEGFLLLSLQTGASPGTGPVFGVYPDALTWASILTPPAVGSPFHFPVGVAGFFPSSPFTAPPGTFSALSGIVMDGVVVLLGPGFSYVGQSNLVRVNW